MRNKFGFALVLIVMIVLPLATIYAWQASNDFTSFQASNNDPQVSDEGISPGSVVDVAVEYVLDKHPQLRLEAPEEWTTENLTPQGLVGYTTILYTGDGWAVRVGSAAVAEPLYEVEIEHTGEMRFVWKGTIDGDWNVVEKEFTLSQN